MAIQHVVIHFHDTITLGGIVISVLVGLIGIAWIGFAVRWRNLYLVEQENARVTLEGREAYKRSAERLGAEKDALQQELAVVEALPHYEDLMKVLTEAFAKVEQSLEQAETRAQERHDAQMALTEKLLSETGRRNGK